MKSHIVWTKVKIREATEDYPETWGCTGQTKGSNFYVNVYGWDGYWQWTIKSINNPIKNFIVGGGAFDTVEDAQEHAVKFAIVQFLRQIDRDIFKKKHYAHNTFCWF